MILAINYADESFSKAQKWNLETALRWGADKVIGYTPKDMDAEFREKNKIFWLQRKEMVSTCGNRISLTKHIRNCRMEII